MDKLSKILSLQGSLDDVAGIWLQDWTGERRFNNSGHDIQRLGLWWNWEVRLIIFFHLLYIYTLCLCLSPHVVRFHPLSPLVSDDFKLDIQRCPRADIYQLPTD